MDNDRSLRIQRALAKDDILTPIEVMKLKYLARKAEQKIIIANEQRSKPYEWSDPPGVMSTDSVLSIIRSVSKMDPYLYRSCEEAYDELVDREDYIATAGYFGLTLLTEINSMRKEYAMQTLLDNADYGDNSDFNNITPSIPRKDFETYSIFYNRKVTFTELLTNFAGIFRYLLKSVDNILTLNYFLGQMIEPQELECLKILKMWLNNRGLEYGRQFNPARICCEKSLILHQIDENHQDYVGSLDYLDGYLTEDFSKNSSMYVKRILAHTISTPYDKLLS